MVISVTVDDGDLVQIVVDGLPPSWETFLAGINAHENLLDFERLWHDCLQEEGRIQSRNGPSKEENLALTTRTRRGKRFTSQKKFPPQKEKSRGGFKGKDFDITRVKCYNYQQKGHFARDCPKIRKGHMGKYRASIAAEDESQRTKTKGASSNQETRREYYLISTLSGSLSNNVESWLVDNGASRDMT